LSIKEKGVVGVVRYIGMDVHREFAQLAVVEDGLLRDEGRIGVTPEALREWAAELRLDDEVALEATGNSDAIANLLTPIVGRVVVSNPAKTRAIAEAKVKTDKVDARILAQLLAADLSAAGVVAGRSDPGAASAGHPPRAPGSATNQDQKPGSCDLGAQLGPDSAGVGFVRQDRPALVVDAAAASR
jgi:Transposase